MHLKKLLLLVSALTISVNILAQRKTNSHNHATEVSMVPADFCSSLKRVMENAPNDYKNFAGKTIFVSSDYTVWESTYKISGAIYCKIASSGWSYNKGFNSTQCSSRSRDTIVNQFEKYKNALSVCLSGMGYPELENTRDHPGRLHQKACTFRATLDDGQLAWDITKPVLSLEIDSSVNHYNLRLSVWMERNH